MAVILLQRLWLQMNQGLCWLVHLAQVNLHLVRVRLLALRHRIHLAQVLRVLALHRVLQARVHQVLRLHLRVPVRHLLARQVPVVHKVLVRVRLHRQVHRIHPVRPVLAVRQIHRQVRLVRVTLVQVRNHRVVQ